MADLAMRPLARTDVDTVAAMHRAAFPDFFLSQLGDAFLREFYLAHVDDDSAIGIVVEADDCDGPVGVVVGTLDPRRFYRQLAKRRWHALAWAAAPLCVRRPAVIGRVARGLFYRGESERAGAGALLSSICVYPSHQGRGCGAELCSGWTREAARRGAVAAHLTTDADDNSGTLAFYRHMGWRQIGAYETRQGRKMVMLEVDLTSG